MSRWIRAGLASCVLAVGIAGVPASAFAQNLLLNPHFDTDIANWTATGLSFDSTQDAAASLTSGSAQQTITLPTVGTLLHQCVAVTPGTSYDFGGSIRPTVLSNGGGAGFEILFFPTTDCTSFGAVGGATSIVTTLNVFTTVSSSAVAPGPALSAQFVAGFNADGNFQANFDDLFFQPSAAVPAMPDVMLLALAAAVLLIGTFTIGRMRRHRPQSA